MSRVTSKLSRGSQVVTAEERDEVRSRSKLFHESRQLAGTIASAQRERRRLPRLHDHRKETCCP
jgi:hypothetical protein